MLTRPLAHRDAAVTEPALVLEAQDLSDLSHAVALHPRELRPSARVSVVRPPTVVYLPSRGVFRSAGTGGQVPGTAGQVDRIRWSGAAGIRGQVRPENAVEEAGDVFGVVDDLEDEALLRSCRLAQPSLADP